uniref:Putative secreted peptide n=1 Tax=Anopheles braziliensis TaxID=58242 RepID=A0A2M3ZU02_9DIPT
MAVAVAYFAAATADAADAALFKHDDESRRRRDGMLLCGYMTEIRSGRGAVDTATHNRRGGHTPVTRTRRKRRDTRKPRAHSLTHHTLQWHGE